MPTCPCLCVGLKKMMSLHFAVVFCHLVDWIMDLGVYVSPTCGGFCAFQCDFVDDIPMFESMKFEKDIVF